MGDNSHAIPFNVGDHSAEPPSDCEESRSNSHSGTMMPSSAPLDHKTCNINHAHPTNETPPGTIEEPHYSLQPDFQEVLKEHKELPSSTQNEFYLPSNNPVDCIKQHSPHTEENMERSATSQDTLREYEDQKADIHAGSTSNPVHEANISGTTSYQCHFCSHNFADCNMLSEHTKVMHSALDPKVTERLESVDSDSSDSEDHSGAEDDPWSVSHVTFDQISLARLMSLNKCHLCSEEFKLRSFLLDHIQISHNGEGKQETKSRAMRCLFCPKFYFDERRLLKHESCHHEKSEATKCLNCGEIFENYKALKCHKKRTTTDTSCSTCFKKFPNELCLQSHMKYKHDATESETKNMQTDVTEKDDISSGTSSPVNKHRKLRCRFCSKKCSHRKNLLRHEMCHPDGTATVECNLCSELFENYKLLKIHKKQQESQAICSVCSKKFPNQKCLSNHFRNSHSTFDCLDDLSDDAEVSVNLNSNTSNNEDVDYSSEGSSVYLDALPRYTVSDSGEPLRITIKQEKEDNYPDSPYSVTSSATPPTPPTPSPQGPPTPSPPPFPPYVEESSEGSEEGSSDGSSYVPRSRKHNTSSSASRRKSSLRTPRKILPSDIYFESSSEASGNDDPADFLYVPKKEPEEEEEDEDDSDEDPDWRQSRNSFTQSKKRGPPIVDDESDDDPDWRKTWNSVSSPKKRVTRGRGRGRKKSVEDFPRLVQPKVRRPRARGCGGQKAHDAAAALAEAVDEMEFSMPELKVVIRPLKRSLGGSITKASVKRYSEVLASDSDYLVNSNEERNQEGSNTSSVLNVNSDCQGVNEKSNTAEDVYCFEENELKDEEPEKVVIKLEPHEIIENDSPKCNETSSYDKSRDSFEEGLEHHELSSAVGEEDMKEIHYVCKFCGRELQYRSHLLRHLRRVHGGEGVDEVMRRLMKCRFCSKQYSNELSLIHHEKLHDGTNKIKCSKCEEVFEDKNALRRHQRKTHWEHQPVECSVCKKQLADNTCLKAHMKHMHTAEERKVTVFTCETCGRQLHTKTAFQNHVASKCGTNLLFPCDTCGKSFSFKGSLKAHQLLHTGVKSFLCRFCGKSFHQKGEMKRHERKHTGEKPFVCNVCGRAFAYRESLLGHSAVHTGIKPFPCKACGMRFSCSGNLVKHRRSNNCKASREQSDSSSPSVGTVRVNTSSAPAGMGSDLPISTESRTTVAVGLVGPNTSCSSNINMQGQVAPLDRTSGSSLSFIPKTTSAEEIASVNVLSTHNVDADSLSTRVVNTSSYSLDPQNFLSNSVRANTTSSSALESSQINPIPHMSSPLPLKSSYGLQNSFAERKLDTVIHSPSQERRGIADMKVSMSELPASSVIKTNPIMAMKSVSVPSPLLMNVNLKTEPQDEINQSYGMNYASNRSGSHPSTVYETQDCNAFALHNAYGASGLSAGYSENQYRQLNHSSINERHLAQITSDARIARNDSLFDRESLIRQQMNRQVIERSVDRQASRLLDCFNGVQFGGIDRRTQIQSFSASSSHPAAYSNIHASHFSNYTTAHASSASNSHSSLYTGNSMVPGQMNFANFSSGGPMTICQNNQVPAHSVSHPATHMGHFGAFFGHFGHTPVHPSSSFPRYSLSHNMSATPNQSFPNNHRI